MEKLRQEYENMDESSRQTMSFEEYQRLPETFHGTYRSKEVERDSGRLVFWSMTSVLAIYIGLVAALIRWLFKLFF